MINTNLSSNKSNLEPHLYSNVSSITYEGIYHSNSINRPSADVYVFCQDEKNINNILSDLPEKIKNFLDLELANAESLNNGMFKVEWRNKINSDIKGTLSLSLTPVISKNATVVIANALFGEYTMDNEGPSDLINVFLKRLKALAETGQLATIKGQPNGKDEEEMRKHSTIQH